MTDPDAAKLLQAQEAARLCSVSDPMFAVHMQTMRDFILNTRPQPAPSEGEPNLERGIRDEICIIMGEVFKVSELTALELKYYRLGLSAQPKVEDAEVASYVGRLHAEGVAWLTEKDGEAIADLLESLSTRLATALFDYAAEKEEVKRLRAQLENKS